ncbi:MAG: hypothetical protein HY289_10880 [Planctomycetes bacterium]|nr:hypothetical protein [Planctomycetota bacterium]
MPEAACPYCNAILPSLTAAPAAEKLPCPRCGELVPASRWQVDASVTPPSPAMSAAIGAGRPGKRKTAVIIVSIMVTMAVVGLSYALWTIQVRRDRDPKPMLDPITYRKPLELKGLGYLPKDCDIIVGLHLAELLADKKVGKPLLEEPRPAALDWVAKQLPRMTGMPLEEIDHVLLAGSFDQAQVVMVVKTRRAYSLEKIVESVHPTRSGQHEKLALYEFPLNPMGEAMLWCVEEKTLVCVIRLEPPKVEHLRGLSATPRKVEDVLPATLHDALAKRLARQQYAWAAGRFDRLGLLKEALMLIPPDKAALLKDLKTFAVGLEPVEGLTLTGHFHMNDAKSAGKLKTFLENVTIDGATQKLAMPKDDKEEQWLTWQLRGDPAAMRTWLNQGREPKR